MDQLKYPIGKFSFPDSFTDHDLKEWISEIKGFPQRFAAKARTLSKEHLKASYRPGGWTTRQVIHHVPDSHLNAYCRFKWVLTEDSPTIKPYFEDRWAALPDTMKTPIETSLQLLLALHERWSNLLSAMNRSDFDKYYVHPEYGRQYSLGSVCKLYAWHGKHHLGHLLLVKPD